MTSKIRELAIALYNEPNNKKVGIEFEQLPLYEQALWKQSARQVIKARKEGGK